VRTITVRGENQPEGICK